MNSLVVPKYNYTIAIRTHVLNMTKIRRNHYYIHLSSTFPANIITSIYLFIVLDLQITGTPLCSTFLLVVVHLDLLYKEELDNSLLLLDT